MGQARRSLHGATKTLLNEHKNHSCHDTADLRSHCKTVSCTGGLIKQARPSEKVSLLSDHPVVAQMCAKKNVTNVRD